MSCKMVFEVFDDDGELRLPNKTDSFGAISWEKHPMFDGVELKTLVSGKDSGGAVSYHLVRIAPYKTIGLHRHERQLETHEILSGTGICVNDGQELAYDVGVISLFPMGVAHEVTAGSNGLCLFAKFIPALD